MILDADRITHMLEAIAKMKISLGNMSKTDFLASAVSVDCDWFSQWTEGYSRRSVALGKCEWPIL